VTVPKFGSYKCLLFSKYGCEVATPSDQVIRAIFIACHQNF